MIVILSATKIYNKITAEPKARFTLLTCISDVIINLSVVDNVICIRRAHVSSDTLMHFVGVVSYMLLHYEFTITNDVIIVCPAQYVTCTLNVYFVDVIVTQAKSMLCARRTADDGIFFPRLR